MSDKLVLSVVLDADEKGLVSGLKLGGAELREFNEEADNSKQPLDSLNKNTISTTKAINFLGGALAALGLGNLSADMYESIDSMQGFQAQLKTITGDLSSANVELDRLIGFARTTPFTLEQSVEAFTKLTHLGLNPSERAMLSYGNTASAMGKDMMQMVEAVADASVFEFERLKEFGIKASQEKNKVRFTFQGVTTEVAKNSKAIQSYLLAIGETQFAGAMNDQMDRLSAKSSNLGMSMDILYSKIGEAGATDLAGKAIDTLANGVELLAENLPEVIDKVETMAGFFAVGAAMHYAPKLFTLMRTKAIAYSVALNAANKSTTLLANKQSALMALWAGWEIGSYINDEFVEARVAGLAFIGALDKGVTHLTFGFKKGALAIDLAWNNALSFIYGKFGELLDLIGSGASLLGMDTYAAKFKLWSDEVKAGTRESKSLEDAIISLDAERTAAIATIDKNVTALVAHELQQDKNNANIKANSEALGANDIATLTNTENVNANTASVESNSTAVELNTDAFEALQDRLDPFNKLTKQLTADQDLLTVAFDTGKLSAEEYEKAQKNLAEEFKGANEKLTKSVELTGSYEKEQLALIKSLAKGKISVEEFEEANSDLVEQYKETIKQTESAIASVDDFASSWEKAIERVDEAIADGWLDLLEGKSTNVFESILGGFKRMLAEMLHMAITKPIMLNIQAAAGGIFSGGAGGVGAGAGGGIFDIISSGLSGGIGGGIMGIGNLLTSAGGLTGLSSLGVLGSGVASTGAILSTQGIFGGMGTALSNIGGLFSSGSMLGGIGAALPVVGLVAGAASLLDGLTGGSLFGTGYKTTDAGVNLAYSGGGFDGENFEKQKKKKSFFRGSRKKTVTSDLDDSVVKGMNDYFDGIESLIVHAADTLDITEVVKTVVSGGSNNYKGDDIPPGETETTTYTKSLEEYLNDFTAKSSISFKDLSEEDAAKAIQEWSINTADRMVNDVFGGVLSGMQAEGENLTDTLARVINQLAVTESAFDAINLSLTDLAATAGVSSLQFADDVVTEAGGMERLASLIQSYQSAFFSEEELLVSQLTNAAAMMDSALEAIGAEQDDFRAQFESASNSGLSADEIVSWLEAGNLVAQVNALTEQLGSIAGENSDALINQALENAKDIAVDFSSGNGEENAVIEATKETTEAQTEHLTSSMNEQTVVMQDLNETSKVHHTEQIDMLSKIQVSMQDMVVAIQESSTSNNSQVQEMTQALSELNTDIRIAAKKPHFRYISPIKPVVGEPL